ncbi:hypothetical protein A33K_15739 [Burkholderia humptydooensis MSMB43]|uniref:Uncharacterized protein n=1 Tax=Burkholderia humptydooensis MSMB43 TaxID=441157 RepID=A0ABN0G692_9BURK|nr:hypothetical protein A33K_15739 [Burkholderia humptydooensis MSMB43]
MSPAFARCAALSLPRHRCGPKVREHVRDAVRLAQRDAVIAQNRIGGDRVKVELRQRPIAPNRGRIARPSCRTPRRRAVRARSAVRRLRRARAVRARRGMRVHRRCRSAHRATSRAPHPHSIPRGAARAATREARRRAGGRPAPAPERP